ncbi:MAG: hypothetical protein HFJ33_03445 [Clostridia bacterium]|nr:hypothetical protein [Clostridia bacterium]
MSTYRYIGLSYGRCPNCSKIYSTGLKLYSDMNANEKEQLRTPKIGTTIALIFTCFAILFIVLVGIASTINTRILEDYSLYILGIAFVISIPIGIVLGNSLYKHYIELTIDNFEIDEELKQKILSDGNQYDEDLSELLKKLQ